MKLLKISKLPTEYVAAFYAAQPGLANKSYAEQKAALDFDACGWADNWSHALTHIGYEVTEIAVNVEPMQRAWAKEHSIPQWQSQYPAQIALIQARSFQPDVLWFNDTDEILLAEIKAAIPGLRLVLGWVGSALSAAFHNSRIDLMLSCAQESVDYLRQQGGRAEQLHHAFDPRIIDRLKLGRKQYDFTFIGQLFRLSQFHLLREQILLELARLTDVTIFSSSARLGYLADVRSAVFAVIHRVLSTLKRLGVDQRLLASLPRIGVLANSSQPPFFAVHPVLRRHLQHDVYGLVMYQVLRDSCISLNIHADSSPLFASNMRLFEATGVGTCLMTDWRDNLAELFVPEVEVVTYRNLDECVEKTRWLLDHPVEREEIARAGQQRVLKDHTFAQRAIVLDEIIRSVV